MAISRKPKAKTEDHEPIFGAPTAQIFEDVDNEDGRVAEKEEEDRLEKLAQQLADMQGRLSEMSAMNMQLMAGGPRSQVTEEFQPQDPLSVKLPDPALDPDGYDVALTERARIRADNDRRQQDIRNRKDKSIKDKADALQSAFAEKYPDMASDEERMSFVTAQVARDAAKKGLDIERYMFLNQAKFIEDVAAKYVKVFGDPSEGDDEGYVEEDRRPAPRTRTRTRANNRSREEDDEGRSAGIFGGTESGGRPGKGRRDDEEGVGGDLISDMQAMQRKTGFW